MKAIEQDFSVVLFMMLNKVVLTFESVDEILKCDAQMKAIEQDFSVVLLLCRTRRFKLLRPWLKTYSTTLKCMKTIEQCFSAVLFMC